MPASTTATATDRCPSASRIIGTSRSELAARPSSASIARGDPRARAAPSTRRGGAAALLSTSPTSPVAFDDDGATTGWTARSTSSTSAAGAAAPRLLPRDGARVLRADRRAQLGDARARPSRGRRGARRASRSRSGATSPRRASSTTRVLLRVRRGADLPHRPLPRQGDGPEPDGAALRELAVRADVEPQPHRPRADHRRRGHRRSRAAAGYYDASGALRDMVQNHMLQLLCLAGDGAADRASPPTTVRDEKVKVLRAIKPPRAGRRRRDGRARRSTRAGAVGGEAVPGYLEEIGVPPDSTTETYVALRLEIDNWRWAGVPFYLRTGKRLARKLTEIAVTLKPVPAPRLRQDGSIGVAPEPARARPPARRGRVAARCREDARRRACAIRAGAHGVPLRHDVPVAVPGGVRAADPGRDARRRDAVHARRRGRGAVAHLRSDRAGLGERRPARSRSTRPAPRVPPKPTRSCSRATRGGASETSCSSRATQSGAPTARRPRRSRPHCVRLLSERHGKNAACIPARTLNLVCVVDARSRAARPRAAQRVGRYIASRTIVCAVEPGRTDDRRARQRSASDTHPRAGRACRAAGDGGPQLGERHLPHLDVDRRSARRLRPADRRLVAVRTRRTRSACCSRSPGRAAGLHRGLASPGAAMRRSCRWLEHARASISPGCARRRGASGSRRPSIPSRCGPTCAGSAP